MVTDETIQQELAALKERMAQLEQENATLRERAEWLGAFFDQAPIGFVLESKGGWVIESNPTMQEMLGYTAEEMRGMAFTEFSHPDDLTSELKLFEELHTGSCTSYINEKRYICKNGETRWGRVRVSFLHEPSALSIQPVVIGVVEDITHLREPQEEEDDVTHVATPLEQEATT